MPLNEVILDGHSANSVEYYRARSWPGAARDGPTGPSQEDVASGQSIGEAMPVSRWCRSSHLPSTSRLIM
jgi:hypothetical protein